METTNLRLKQAILRSEKAYEIYKANPVFYNAHKIYKANELVYSELENQLLTDHKQNQDIIIEYLFHLDDWMCQFNHHKTNIQPKLTDDFIFERVEGMIPFSQTFKSI